MLVLQIQNIFSNVSKGMLASKADMMEAFGTTNEKTICAVFILFSSLLLI